MQGNKRRIHKMSQRQLLKLESRIGAGIFGPIPKHHQREFFCLDENTWIWHESWFDDDRKQRLQTVRYEIQDRGILKVQEGGRYQYLMGQELTNFCLAIKTYYEHVVGRFYQTNPYGN